MIGLDYRLAWDNNIFIIIRFFKTKKFFLWWKNIFNDFFEFLNFSYSIWFCKYFFRTSWLCLRAQTSSKVSFELKNSWIFKSWLLFLKTKRYFSILIFFQKISTHTKEIFLCEQFLVFNLETTHNNFYSLKGTLHSHSNKRREFPFFKSQDMFESFFIQYFWK